MATDTSAAKVGAAQRRIRRGLEILPASLLPLPSVMSSPPTVTPGANNSNPMAASAVTANSAIPNSTPIAWTDPRFRFLGGDAVVAGVSFPDSIMAFYDQITSSVNPANMRVAFTHDGPSFEFCVKILTVQKFRLWVNGQPATVTAQLPGGSNGNVVLILVNFGSTAMRHIVIEGHALYFGGVRIGPNDSLSPSLLPPSPRAMVYGDSYTEGTGAGASFLGYPQTLGHLTGWHDLWNSGVGGTGYLNDAGGGGKTTFRGRVADDLVAYAPDVVIVAGGINDYVGHTAADIGTEAGLLFAAIRSGVPGVTLIVLGPWDNAGTVPTANFVQTRDALRVAALANGASLFIDNIGGPYPWSGNVNNYTGQGWITGTGHVGATTGSGNADLYIASDAVHPSQAGHDYLAHRLAADIMAWRQAGAPAGAVAVNGLVTVP